MALILPGLALGAFNSSKGASAYNLQEVAADEAINGLNSEINQLENGSNVVSLLDWQIKVLSSDSKSSESEENPGEKVSKASNRIFEQSHLREETQIETNGDLTKTRDGRVTADQLKPGNMILLEDMSKSLRQKVIDDKKGVLNEVIVISNSEGYLCLLKISSKAYLVEEVTKLETLADDSVMFKLNKPNDLIFDSSKLNSSLLSSDIYVISSPDGSDGKIGIINEETFYPFLNLTYGEVELSLQSSS